MKYLIHLVLLFSMFILGACDDNEIQPKGDIIDGIYEGKMYYEVDKFVFREEMQFQSFRDTFIHLIDTFDISIKIKGKNYFAGMGDGDYAIENDSILFNLVNDYCPPNADCGYFIAGQIFRIEQHVDSLFLVHDLDWFVSSPIGNLELAKDSSRLFNRVELVKVD